MDSRSSTRRTMRIDVEKWALKKPFRITGHCFVDVEVVVVTLESDGQMGRGEAAGVYYLHDNVHAMVKQIEAVRTTIEAGVDRQALQRLLPAGGARNAVDCALWELDARRAGLAVWQLARLSAPRPLVTTYTLSADDPDEMAADARAYSSARALKLKLTGEPIDGDRVRAVRAVRSDVWLGIDANQGFTRESLELILPIFIDNRVELIEQPFRIGSEADLDGFESPIPIAADESVQGVSDIASLVGRFNLINIKLDKCGGLTEALSMTHEARRLGLDVMIGNMTGTSLAMAPAYLIGQMCRVVDLDGAILLRTDRTSAAHYENGEITCSESVWGGVSDVRAL
jgi:L-alanine-DL-glutamate epimerase-like enolase superfamily enzyme